MKSSFFFVLSAISGLVKAVDVVTPGPGMPSLESVGLSNEKLYNMALEEATNPGTHLVSRAVSRVESPLLSKRFEPHCVPDASAEYFCALQCILYLENLGTTPCVATTSGLPYFVTCKKARESGSMGAVLYAFPLANKPSVSSYCRDVARGISWVTDNCRFVSANCGLGFICVGGFAAAWGNGEMLVKLRGFITQDEFDRNRARV